MKEEDVIRLLQYYQHDLMNNLQVVQGYLSMDQLNIAKDKMDDFVDQFSEERLLMKINAPQFILWVLQFNHQQHQMRLTYQINDKMLNLQAIDEPLVKQCKWLTEQVLKHGKSTELYQIHLKIQQQTDAKVAFEMSVIGEFDLDENVWNECKNYEQLPQVKIKKMGHGFTCTFVFFIE